MLCYMQASTAWCIVFDIKECTTAMPTNELITPVAVVRRDQQGVIRGTYTVAEETLVDARANMEAVRQLSGGQPALLLIDSRMLRHMTPQVRAYYVSEETARIIRALAIVIGSPLSRLMGNVFLRFQNSRVPTKLFTDDAQAVRWLVRYREVR